MANFLEDPRLRQRWNQISHNAEAVTENAAAGIWTFQHNYVNPCLASLASGVESCTAVCLGDREERARRRRERERAGGRAEYSFDFYDDWYADDEAGFGGLGGGGGGGGILGGWDNNDWDRLLAGTGSSRREGAGPGSGPGEIAEQPKRKRGMSYGTRGPRRKPPAEQDPTIIPSTQPIGFLGRLPWKIGGTLRYKPSAADLQDHPVRHDGTDGAHPADEAEPLLGTDSEDEYFYDPTPRRQGYGSQHQHHDQQRRPAMQTRKRSSTAGSGDTSDSYRSRGDLFPSDGEGDEDAVPLDDDEFTVALDKVVDDRSSNKTRSSKGKRVASGAEGGSGSRSASGGSAMSRTVSRTTIGSTQTRLSLRGRRSSQSIPQVAITITGSPDAIRTAPSIEDLQKEEMRIEREEDEEVERKRKAAAQLAAERGLGAAAATAAAAGNAVADDAEAVVVENKNELANVAEVPEPPSPEGQAAAVSDEPVLEPEPELLPEPEPIQAYPGEAAGTAPAKKSAPTPDDEPPRAAPSESEFIPARLPNFR